MLIFLHSREPRLGVALRAGERGQRRWRPHGAAALAEVRRLIETTQLSYRALPAGRACRAR